MKNVTLFLFAIWISATQVAWASTFVGNGGNAADLELEISKTTLIKTYEYIQENPNQANKLCTCPSEYADFPLCKNLEKLSEEQTNFCSQFLQKKAPELALKLKNEVGFIWTEEPLFVQEHQSKMSVDALTNYQNKMILLNKENFLARESYERNFLLAHESFHLTDYQKKPLLDEQSVGPFDSATGGREFLNALAAVVVLKSNESGIAQQYRRHLERSRQTKKFWLSLDYTQFKAQEELGTLYIPDQYKGSTLSAKYFFTDTLGVGLHYGWLKAKDTFLTSIESTDTIENFGVGLFYKWMPFENKLSFWGQSFFQLGAKYEFLKANFKMDENIAGTILTVEDSAQTQYGTLECSYFIPLIHGFWIQAGVGYHQPHYAYSENIDAKYNQGRVSTNVGVSYGF